jgi:NADH-quinone oxidoreductase subunit N
METMDLIADLQTALPEVILAGFGLLAVLLGAIVGDRIAGFLRYAAVLALAVASVLAFRQMALPTDDAFNNLFRVTPFSSFARGFAYALGAASLFMAGGALKAGDMNRYEYSILTVFAALGGGVMLSASNLMTLYMGIEMLSLSSYVLAAFQRDNVRSSEAGLKYFVLGALASGLLLYGASLVYGFTGSANFEEINAAEPSVGLTLGLVLMITGLAFKASAAPLHIWTPDVYAGAPAPVVAFFATGPKLAAVALIANVMFQAFGAQEDSWRLVIAIMAAMSMLIGAFGALVQDNIKRILAYSSISNVGYALIGVAAGESIGSASVLVYMSIYVIGTLGLFAGVLALRRGGQAVESLSDLNGLAQSKPGVALGLVVLVFSIAGIPPAAGFWGKWEVFQAGIRADLLWLVLVGAVASVVSLGYYLRIVWAIMVKPAGDQPLDRTDASVALSVLVSAVLVFPVITIWIQRLLDAASHAATG